MSHSKNPSLPTYDIRVISLKDSHERRARITRQIHDLQLSFQFFDAIDARQLAPADLQTIITQHRPYDGMSLGTIAVGKSHYEVIKNWAENEQTDYLIVMEDDAEITHQFQKFIDNLRLLKEISFAILKIGGRYQKRRRTALAVHHEEFMITYPFLPSFCNVAYIVDRRAVERVLSHLVRFNFDVDEKITKDARIGMPVYEVSPFIVEESGLPSTLSGFSSSRKRIAFLPLRRLVNNFHIAKRVGIILINNILFNRTKPRLVKIR